MAKQLTLAQRYHIAVLLSEGKMQKDTASESLPANQFCKLSRNTLNYTLSGKQLFPK